MKNVKWHFRRNKKRKIGSQNKGMHPSLIIGESDDGKKYYNIGLTKKSKRGQNWCVERRKRRRHFDRRKAY